MAAYLRYEAVYNQLKGTEQGDVMKLYELSKHLQDDVIDQKNIAESLNSQARSLFDAARSSMVTSAMEKFTDAFLNNRLWTNIAHISFALDTACHQCFDNIIDKVVENVLGKWNVERLLRVSRESAVFAKISQLISIYAAVFRKLQRDGDLQDDDIIQLAYRVKEVMEWDTYRYISSETRFQIEDMINKLPKSVKTIVFSAKICITNVRYHEYLFSPVTPIHLYDQDRRYAFTWTAGDRYDYDPNEPSKFVWKLERNTKDEYQIINSQFNEHLFTDINGSLVIDGHRRHVLTWRKGGSLLGSSWKLEPSEEYVYIKNLYNNEYLFTDYGKKRDEQSRFLFTYVYGGKTDDSKWEMVDCSNLESNIKSRINDTTKKLPNSLKNSVFSTKVCIKNVHYNEFLYAAGPSKYWYDKDRRHVFTWKRGDRYGPNESSKFAWILEQNNDQYQIINFQFNEHLYAEVEGSLMDGHGRYVLTWREGGNRTGSSWKLEYDGEDVYIKNAYNDEYLFADFEKRPDDERRLVFSFVLGGKTADSKWQFADCGNFVYDSGYQIENTRKTPMQKNPMSSVVSSTKICLRNVRYNEYLYAEGPLTYWYDADRRHLFTWKGGNRYDANEPGKFVWKLERNNDQYQIINSQYSEHLYAEIDGSLRNGTGRYLVTWRKGGNRTGSTWKLEREGEYVYIKNARNNEYLFADYAKRRDDDRRLVFTFLYGGKTSDSKWEIINCANFETDIKSQIDPTKNISNSFKNLVLSIRVCFRNIHHNEFLYASGSATDWHDQDRRHVYTWKKGDRNGPDEGRKFAWRLQRNDNDEYQIINSQFKEHLYAEVNGSLTLGHRRHVLTWRKGDSRSGSLWKFEHQDDYVFIKNVHYNEYLFADFSFKDDEKRLVFSYTYGGKTDDSKWEIVNCSDQ